MFPYIRRRTQIFSWENILWKIRQKNRFSGSSISSRFSSSFSSSRVVTTGNWTMPILSYYISFCHIIICYITLYHIINYYAISSYSLNNSLRTPDHNRLQCRKFCIHVSAFLLHRCIDDDRTLIFKYQYIVAIMKRNTLSCSRSQCLKNSYRVSQKKASFK